MEKELKLWFGKMLGEIYKIQYHSKELYCPVGPETIYGLINGFEGVIEDNIPEYSITQEDYENMISVLTPIHQDSEKLNNFEGYYDIEHDLEKLGINRSKAMDLFDFFSLRGAYREIISKMDSSGSPSEMRTFKTDI